MSCGLIMFNENDKILLSKSKKGKYTFPKGKIEKDETEYECAKREFVEESGISGIVYSLKNDDKIEISEKGKRIKYFVCKIMERKNSFCFELDDPDNDIVQSRFFYVDEAYELENFSIERKEILTSIKIEELEQRMIDEI